MRGKLLILQLNHLGCAPKDHDEMRNLSRWGDIWRQHRKSVPNMYVHAQPTICYEALRLSMGLTSSWDRMQVCKQITHQTRMRTNSMIQETAHLVVCTQAIVASADRSKGCTKLRSKPVTNVRWDTQTCMTGVLGMEKSVHSATHV